MQTAHSSDQSEHWKMPGISMNNIEIEVQDQSFEQQESVGMHGHVICGLHVLQQFSLDSLSQQFVCLVILPTSMIQRSRPMIFAILDQIDSFHNASMVCLYTSFHTSSINLVQQQ
jgi:hypothetical protein